MLTDFLVLVQDAGCDGGINEDTYEIFGAHVTPIGVNEWLNC